MRLAATVVIAVVALLHVGFLVLETALWRTPIGRKVFGLPPDVVEAAAPLAANQGLYNGFLAAGLIWGLWLGAAGFAVQVFFLCCVTIAGIFGGLTAKRSILLVQGLPGLAGLILVLLARR